MIGRADRYVVPALASSSGRRRRCRRRSFAGTDRHCGRFVRLVLARFLEADQVFAGGKTFHFGPGNVDPGLTAVSAVLHLIRYVREFAVRFTRSGLVFCLGGRFPERMHGQTSIWHIGRRVVPFYEDQTVPCGIVRRLHQRAESVLHNGTGIVRIRHERDGISDRLPDSLYRKVVRRHLLRRSRLPAIEGVMLSGRIVRSGDRCPVIVTDRTVVGRTVAPLASVQFVCDRIWIDRPIGEIDRTGGCKHGREGCDLCLERTVAEPAGKRIAVFRNSGAIRHAIRDRYRIADLSRDRFDGCAAVGIELDDRISHLDIIGSEHDLIVLCHRPVFKGEGPAGGMQRPVLIPPADEDVIRFRIRCACKRDFSAKGRRAVCRSSLAGCRVVAEIISHSRRLRSPVRRKRDRIRVPRFLLGSG